VGVDAEATPAAGADGAGLRLTAEDRAALDAGAKQGLLRAVAAQGIMALAAGLACWAVGGAAAGWSALAGAGAYFIPNTLFALRLRHAVPGRASPLTFFFGQAGKLGAAAAFLALAVRLAGDAIVWPALLAGLLCVLKGYVLLLMFRKLS